MLHDGQKLFSTFPILFTREILSGVKFCPTLTPLDILSRMFSGGGLSWKILTKRDFVRDSVESTQGSGRVRSGWVAGQH